VVAAGGIVSVSHTHGVASHGVASHGVASHGVDSEVGRLRTVLVHRPGLELKRMTPRSRDRLLFETLPWVGRAQQEHDVFTQSLRDQDVEVLYITELLQDALEYQPAWDEAIGSVLADAELGDELKGQVYARLDSLGPEELAQVLIAGLTPDDLPDGHGLVFQLLDRHDFVIDPLPNLVFARDSSFWVGDRVAVSSLVAPGRRREADLLGVIYAHHPRFAGIKRLYGPEFEHVDGGDVLLLAPSVLAVGVGQRTTPAGVERLSRHVLDAGLAHTVLAIPVDQRGGSGYLDTLCTVIDTDTVVMHPAIAFTLTAHTITPRSAGTRVSRPQPFLEAAAQAMGIERLQIIDTGLDPVSGRRGQWDDGNNALALGRRLAVCYERNTETITRLEEAGVEVIRVPGSELGSSRGGPRCMSCAIGRDPAAEGERDSGDLVPAEPAEALQREVVQIDGPGPDRSPAPEVAPPGLARPELAPPENPRHPEPARPQPAEPEPAAPEPAAPEPAAPEPAQPELAPA
jgi:arginine deiminase